MTVLVTSGAGYVGAHMLLALLDADEASIAIDDLTKGARWLVPSGARFIKVSLDDVDGLSAVFQQHDVKEVIHFAGAVRVDQSLKDPLTYYRTNTAQTLSLVEACVANGVERIVFSSTASVYGLPDQMPISEAAPICAITPYGASMAMSERIIIDAAAAHGFSYVILRYFNVAGADPNGRAGEIGKPTHLIKVAAQIAVGVRRENLQIYGSDYPTPDGTAIRDYVHVSDLAEAHLLALAHMRDGGGSLTLNCGYGRGYSVNEVIDAVGRVSGAPLPFENAERRAGDPPQLIADSAAIRMKLDWRPRYDDLDFVVRTAIDWERKLAKLEKHPNSEKEAS